MVARCLRPCLRGRRIASSPRRNLPLQIHSVIGHTRLPIRSRAAPTQLWPETAAEARELLLMVECGRPLQAARDHMARFSPLA